jgi:hypothetical protein
MAAVSIAGSTGLVVSNTYHSRIHKQDRADSKYEPEWKNFKGSHILTRVDTGRTGPDLTFGPVHWTLTEIRSTGQTGHWTDPGQSSGRNG